MTWRPQSGEGAAFRRGCSASTAATPGGSSCRLDRGGEETGYWVWRAAGYKEKHTSLVTPHSAIHSSTFCKHLKLWKSLLKLLASDNK